MKHENLRAMLQSRKADLESQIAKFNPTRYLSYETFDAYLDDTYKPCVVGQYAFMPSKVLYLDYVAYDEMFSIWADTVDKNTIPEYNQLHDELQEVIDYLEELE
jgi:hypothetical protein